MKKLVIFMMLILGISTFAAKFNTDGKNHEKELAGSYKGEYENIVVKNNKGKLTFTYNDGSKGYFKPVGKGLYVAVYTVNKNYHGYGTMELYFAYDTKLKTLVQVGEGNEILETYKKQKK